MLAQIFRVLADEAPDMLVDLDLRSPGSRRALVNDTPRSPLISFRFRHRRGLAVLPFANREVPCRSAYTRSGEPKAISLG
jgi:hypothetical protein